MEAARASSRLRPYISSIFSLTSTTAPPLSWMRMASYTPLKMTRRDSWAWRWISSMRLRSLMSRRVTARPM